MNQGPTFKTFLNQLPVGSSYYTVLIGRGWCLYEPHTQIFSLHLCKPYFNLFCNKIPKWLCGMSHETRAPGQKQPWTWTRGWFLRRALLSLITRQPLCTPSFSYMFKLIIFMCPFIFLPQREDSLSSLSVAITLPSLCSKAEPKHWLGYKLGL